MKYIANVMYFDGSEAKLCNTEAEAKSWLKEKNMNGRLRTTIDVMDDKGNYVNNYVYTEGHEDE